MNSLHALGQAIYQAGFDAFATVPANPLQRMLPVLKQALLEERYPDFVDGDLEKRVDPRRLQSSAQTVITLAVSYNTGPPGSTPPLHGTISVLPGVWIITRPAGAHESSDRLSQGTPWCSAVHEGGGYQLLIDRALAVEAGLGYPGSNCAVYVPPFGSWVFLGEILVDIELPPTSRGNRRTGPALSTAISHQPAPQTRSWPLGRLNPSAACPILLKCRAPVPWSSAGNSETDCGDATPASRSAPSTKRLD